MKRGSSRSVSISGRAFAILRAYCDEQNITPGEFVTAMVDEVAPLVRTLDDAAKERTDAPIAVTAPFCAICVSETGPFTLEPYGRTKVAMCAACREEHPRSGRYSFEGGRPDQRGQSNRASVIGEGNRSSHGRNR